MHERKSILYQGYWTCGAQLRKCETDEDCPGHCTDKTCCRLALKKETYYSIDIIEIKNHKQFL